MKKMKKAGLIALTMGASLGFVAPIAVSCGSPSNDDSQQISPNPGGNTTPDGHEAGGHDSVDGGSSASTPIELFAGNIRSSHPFDGSGADGQYNASELIDLTVNVDTSADINKVHFDWVLEKKNGEKLALDTHSNKLTNFKMKKEYDGGKFIVTALFKQPSTQELPIHVSGEDPIDPNAPVERIESVDFTFDKNDAHYKEGDNVTLTASSKVSNINDKDVSYEWTMENSKGQGIILGRGVTVSFTALKEFDNKKIKLTATYKQQTVVISKKIFVAPLVIEPTIKSVSLAFSDNQPVHVEGTNVTINALISPNKTSQVKYQWFKVDNGIETQIAGSTSSITLNNINIADNNKYIKVQVQYNSEEPLTAQIQLKINPMSDPNKPVAPTFTLDKLQSAKFDGYTDTYKGFYFATLSIDGKQYASITGISEPKTGSIEIPEYIELEGDKIPVIAIGDKTDITSQWTLGSSTTQIKLLSNIQYIYDKAFRGITNNFNINISSNTIGIGNAAFENATGLKRLSIRNSAMQYIGDNAFNGAHLESLPSMPQLVSIGQYAFYQTFTSRIDLDFSSYNNLTSIGDYAFANCQINSISCPDSLTSIGSYAFSNAQMTSIKFNTMTSHLRSIGVNAFNGQNLNTDKNGYGLILPNAVTEMDLTNSLFNGCGKVAAPYAFWTGSVKNNVYPANYDICKDLVELTNNADHLTTLNGVVLYNNQLEYITKYNEFITNQDDRAKIKGNIDIPECVLKYKIKMNSSDTTINTAGSFVSPEVAIITDTRVSSDKSIQESLSEIYAHDVTINYTAPIISSFNDFKTNAQFSLKDNLSYKEYQSSSLTNILNVTKLNIPENMRLSYDSSKVTRNLDSLSAEVYLCNNDYQGGKDGYAAQFAQAIRTINIPYQEPTKIQAQSLESATIVLDTNKVNTSSKFKAINASNLLDNIIISGYTFDSTFKYTPVEINKTDSSISFKLKVEDNRNDPAGGRYYTSTTTSKTYTINYVSEVTSEVEKINNSAIFNLNEDAVHSIVEFKNINSSNFANNVNVSGITLDNTKFNYIYKNINVEGGSLTFNVEVQNINDATENATSKQFEVIYSNSQLQQEVNRIKNVAKLSWKLGPSNLEEFNNINQSNIENYIEASGFEPNPNFKYAIKYNSTNGSYINASIYVMPIGSPDEALLVSSGKIKYMSILDAEVEKINNAKIVLPENYNEYQIQAMSQGELLSCLHNYTPNLDVFGYQISPLIASPHIRGNNANVFCSFKVDVYLKNNKNDLRSTTTKIQQFVLVNNIYDDGDLPSTPEDKDLFDKVRKSIIVDPSFKFNPNDTNSIVPYLKSNFTSDEYSSASINYAYSRDEIKANSRLVVGAVYSVNVTLQEKNGFNNRNITIQYTYISPTLNKGLEEALKIYDDSIVLDLNGVKDYNDLKNWDTLKVKQHLINCPEFDESNYSVRLQLEYYDERFTLQSVVTDKTTNQVFYVSHRISNDCIVGRNIGERIDYNTLSDLEKTEVNLSIASSILSENINDVFSFNQINREFKLEIEQKLKGLMVGNTKYTIRDYQEQFNRFGKYEKNISFGVEIYGNGETQYEYFRLNLDFTPDGHEQMIKDICNMSITFSPDGNITQFIQKDIPTTVINGLNDNYSYRILSFREWYVKLEITDKRNPNTTIIIGKSINDSNTIPPSVTFYSDLLKRANFIDFTGQDNFNDPFNMVIMGQSEYDNLNAGTLTNIINERIMPDIFLENSSLKAEETFYIQIDNIRSTVDHDEYMKTKFVDLTISPKGIKNDKMPTLKFTNVALGICIGSQPIKLLDSGINIDYNNASPIVKNIISREDMETIYKGILTFPLFKKYLPGKFTFTDAPKIVFNGNYIDASVGASLVSSSINNNMSLNVQIHFNDGGFIDSCKLTQVLNGVEWTSIDLSNLESIYSSLNGLYINGLIAKNELYNPSASIRNKISQDDYYRISNNFKKYDDKVNSNESENNYYSKSTVIINKSNIYIINCNTDDITQPNSFIYLSLAPNSNNKYNLVINAVEPNYFRENRELNSDELQRLVSSWYDGSFMKAPSNPHNSK